MRGLGSSLFKRIVDRELVTPHIEKAILNQNWPDEYKINVDSKPYYGTGDGKFHPSSHALMPERQLYYVMSGQAEPERFSLQSHMAFVVGDAYHAILQTMLVMSGLSVWEDIERLVVSEEHMGRGRVDAFVTLPDYPHLLVDIKSMNARSFRDTREPYKSWVAQVNCYMDWAGPEYQEAVILAIEKDYPHNLREFRVKKDQALLDEIYAKWGRVRKAIAEGKPPVEKCCSLESAEMQKCPAKDQCLVTY